ncbi:unnamed protein product [Cuscuta campestris]|uniref:Uncharacterized protein n=1 Tax=Cuscuta campestris TaxID=132261 RepID=A0A484NPB4_9ASTE|nr:unnamed protein product [Cuscuta campestris]
MKMKLEFGDEKLTFDLNVDGDVKKGRFDYVGEFKLTSEKRVWKEEPNQNSMYQVVQNLRRLKELLRKLHKDKFNMIHKQVDEKRDELMRIQRDVKANPSQFLFNRERELMHPMNRAIKASYQLKLVEGTDGIARVLEELFSKMLGSTHPIKEIDRKVLVKGKSLTAEQQLELIKEFKPELGRDVLEDADAGL